MFISLDMCALFNQNPSRYTFKQILKMAGCKPAPETCSIKIIQL